ncbi:MAG: Asp-tRNA(Asn)/Glu-tRNA(Gln) amidotransferase subunit GatB [Xanthomonadaceae bacterium]|nr:Asp-tRNA(Asn)/Glu-tRNA(Gln) amidotransferase subunit GatB [Rhodospirillaceae bacterium]NIA17984.1 Asp-tRNA(Asn)/Glu-tRNA(Gln) amidotransferase subunit GatB [Xanthomonadaceae bacterium]
MYDIIIGLEIHAQLKTKSKMFCRCSNDGENQPPNTTICEICTGQPGTLPVANIKAIEWTALTGIALNCKIANFSKFDRKNYFYPDLPKGYQISQYDLPISYNGFLNINNKRIKVIRIHLEEDTGKLLHPNKKNYSLVDYNRCGTPLMELVTAPDITNAEDAKNFCQEYQKILRYLDVSDANMEKGQMRCEANISVQEKNKWKKINDEIKQIGDYRLNPKVELKNINSFKAMEKAINYEIKRQIKAITNNEKLHQETRGWDNNLGKSYFQRTKESADDYRYFPEPDLPPLDLRDIKKRIKKELPELPEAKLKRFITEYGFNKLDAEILTTDKNLAEYTERVISEFRAWLEAVDGIEGTQEEIWEANQKKIIKIISSWLINKLGGIMKSNNVKIKNLKISPENFAEFLTLLFQNKINNASGIKILEKMLIDGEDPSNILEQGNFEQVKNETILKNAIKKAIADNQKAVEEYKNGKINAIQFLVGQVMKETKGKAEPKTVLELLKKLLQ